MADVLRWEDHPLRSESPARSAALAGLIAASAVAAAVGFGHWFYGAFSLAVLTLSVSRYFFPTHYQLDGAGVASYHLGIGRSRRWDEFRRVDERADGLFLSPFARPRRLDAFRGVFLRCHQNREEVVYFVRRHVEN